MTDFSRNLWAPWRMEYIRSLDDENHDGCFLCRYWAAPADDARTHVVWRGGAALAMMNRFPYTGGHLLIAPARHEDDFTRFTEDELLELSRMIRDGVRLLRAALQSEGFNIGFNLGHCAGAGLPGHLHAHIVPRWSGDTNFMSVIGDARVVPEALDAMYRHLCGGARGLGLLT